MLLQTSWSPPRRNTTKASPHLPLARAPRDLQKHVQIKRLERLLRRRRKPRRPAGAAAGERAAQGEDGAAELDVVRGGLWGGQLRVGWAGRLVSWIA